jgi:hypothetical protein
MYLSIYLWLYNSCGPRSLFQFLNLYTVCRIPWKGDLPVARPLPTHGTTQIQNKHSHRHSCLEWNANPRSQRSSDRRQFMLLTARPLWSALLKYLSNCIQYASRKICNEERNHVTNRRTARREHTKSLVFKYSFRVRKCEEICDKKQRSNSCGSILGGNVTWST